MSTKRKLLKDKGVATAYQQVLDDYMDKKYPHRILPDEPRPDVEWLLPHFPVVRPEKSASKVCIVFDGALHFEGNSLSTEALTSPNLQSDVFDIFVKFWKDPVALAGNISHMYHQLVCEEDWPLHCFLWREMDLHKEPEVYQFPQFIFGGCYCPFCA